MDSLTKMTHISACEVYAEVFCLHGLPATSSTHSRKKILFVSFYPYLSILANHRPLARQKESHKTHFPDNTSGLPQLLCAELTPTLQLSSIVTIISTPVTSFHHHLSSNCWVQSHFKLSKKSNGNLLEYKKEQNPKGMDLETKSGSERASGILLDTLISLTFQSCWKTVS